MFIQIHQKKKINGIICNNIIWCGSGSGPITVNLVIAHWNGNEIPASDDLEFLSAFSKFHFVEANMLAVKNETQQVTSAKLQFCS